VALTATIYTVDIDLADNDRAVYESLSLRVARHPSESEDFFWTRIFAYALEFTDGLEFSRGGLSSPDEPALSVRDLTGALRAWIEVGTPDAERLHRASKASPRVAVYVHRDPAQFLQRLAGTRIHQAASIDIWSLDRKFLTELSTSLERRMAFALSVTDRELFLAIGSKVLTGNLTRHAIPG
jgi:uncharacterized protein YaeQ